VGLGRNRVFLNGLTAYLFYRGSRIRRIVLRVSVALYGLSAVIFLTGLDPILLIGAFGFYFDVDAHPSRNPPVGKRQRRLHVELKQIAVPHRIIVFLFKKIGRKICIK